MYFCVKYICFLILWKLVILTYNFMKYVISLNPANPRHSGQIFVSICCCFSALIFNIGSVLVGWILFSTSFCVFLPWKDTSNFLAHFYLLRLKNSFLKIFSLWMLRTDAVSCFWFFLFLTWEARRYSLHFVKSMQLPLHGLMKLSQSHMNFELVKSKWIISILHFFPLKIH